MHRLAPASQKSTNPYNCDVKVAIARGRISHSISSELRDLFQSLYSPLTDEKKVREFELKIAEHLNSDPPVFFPFARTGFFSILEALNLPIGSKILMPTITIKPLLDVALHFKLSPILVDLDTTTGCWDLRSLRKALEEKPQVALLTYLFGVVPNLDEILPELEQSNTVIIEDFSQAYGARFAGKSMGTLGHFGICSTSTTKTLDTYGGALIFSKNSSHLEYLRNFQLRLNNPKRITLVKKIMKNLVRNLATNKIIFSIVTFPAIRLINSQKKQKVGKFTGDRSLSPILNIPREWFEAPTAFQAKIGLRELFLQEDKDRRRMAIAQRYIDEIPSIGPRGNRMGTSVYWQYISVEKSPILLRDFLNNKFIDCATTSLVKLSELSDYGLVQNLSGTNAIYERGVYLPCYHQLTYNEQSRVIRAVKSFYEIK